MARNMDGLWKLSVVSGWWPAKNPETSVPHLQGTEPCPNSTLHMRMEPKWHAELGLVRFSAENPLMPCPYSWHSELWANKWVLFYIAKFVQLVIQQQKTNARRKLIISRRKFIWYLKILTEPFLIIISHSLH